VNHRSGDRHTLLHPATERAYGRVRTIRDPHTLERAEGGLTRCAHTVQFRCKLDVLEGRQRRVEHTLVRDQPDDRASRCTARKVDARDARRTARWAQQPRQHTKQGRLARPVGSEYRETVAVVKREGERADRDTSSETPAEPLDLDGRRPRRRVSANDGCFRRERRLGSRSSHARTLARRGRRGEDDTGNAKRRPQVLGRRSREAEPGAPKGATAHAQLQPLIW